MLIALKEKGIKIGLISNCFSEEAYQIRKSILIPYFDVVCLSYEVGMKKPQSEIFEKCIKELLVEARDCLYVGDGGSYELEAASSVGMEAVQAVWYYKKEMGALFEFKNEFNKVDKPLDIINSI